MDVLLKEKHVTNAGKRLFISQSAMSNLLKQLREIFNDKLFIRGHAGSLIPTSFSISLETRLGEAIEKVKCVFQEPDIFSPEKAKIKFTIGLSDYTECVLFPFLLQHSIKNAPGRTVKELGLKRSRSACLAVRRT